MTEIAIIGDRFMLSDMFEAALREAVGDAVTVRKLDLPWPDEPMEHGYAAPGMDGLKEYMGDPETVIAHVGDAPMLITHLAPLSAGMFDRMPGCASSPCRAAGRSISTWRRRASAA
jgi:D-3-phosphoglycerate dehydrogenase